MMTTIFDLPRELVIEIFSRVPLKSMREVRKTCKKLNTLSKSESFAKLHLAREEAAREVEEYRKVVILDHNLCLMSVTFDDGDPKAKLISSLNQQVKVSQVFHCDGLLLCILKDDGKIMVWNPYWGQTRCIQPRYTYPKMYGFDRYRYALGYASDNNTCGRSHKLLRFFYHYIGQLGNMYGREDRFQWYEIYDFDSDQWTTLDVPLDRDLVVTSKRGVSLKGNTYFCAKKTHTYEDHHLICFDYKREEFGPLMRLPFTSHPFSDRVTLSCVREEKLVVLYTQRGLDEGGVWITTKIEAEEVLWSKFLVLDITFKFLYSQGGFFIDEEKKVVMCVDDDIGTSDTHHILSIVGEAGYIKRLELGERVRGKEWFINRNHNRKELCSYVPSIVQIKQPNKGTRKQQSNSELIRYEEKMSRVAQL